MPAISWTMRCAIDRQHDIETDQILDRYAREMRAARTHTERDEIEARFDTAMRAAVARSCDAHASLAVALN